MSVFERYLTLWVALCIAAGIALGWAMPAAFQAIGAVEIVKAKLQEAQHVYGEAVATNPWLEELCMPLRNVTPILRGDVWLVVDSSGKMLPAEIREALGFVLLAVSGGQPVDLATVYNGRVLRPLAVVAQGAWQSLTPPPEETSR